MGIDRIVILDFGGQYAHLIANRIRRLNVYSEIKRPSAAIEEVREAKGIILSGGPSSVYDPDQPDYNPELFKLGVPILGICYGHQLLCQQFGGKVLPGRTREYGAAELTVKRDRGIFKDLNRSETVWMSHGDSVAELPPGFQIIGETVDCPVAAMGDPARRIYSLQFHPEVTHTPCGMKILRNFIDECGCDRNWTMRSYVESALEEIREEVGGRSVFTLVSGGVDSTVTFVLLNKALGTEHVYGLHIDNGFMRKGETKLIERYLAEQKFDNLRVIDASSQFLKAVGGIVDPEQKRRIVGEVFVDVVEKAVEGLGLDPKEWMLGQGTLYTDTIESGGTESAAVIKTHHNRVEAIRRLISQGRVIEPLAQLYKDEVREAGMELGLPRSLVWRHPFPGPGLSVRALCSDGQADEIGEVEWEAGKIARIFGLDAKVLPIRSVGVQGDFRTYAHPVALIGQADWDVLARISTAITNQIRDVNRVVYLLRPDELMAQSVKRCYLTRQRLDLLREADYIAMKALEENGLMEKVSQMPTVLIPLSSDGKKESIVLRPIYTRDFMTARFAEIPMDVVKKMADDILTIGGIDAVFYDVTHKPPGTTEWE